MKVRLKPLQLPSRLQFLEIVKSVLGVNKRFSSGAADLIEFLAYGGYRKSEAQNCRWSDCDFERGQVLVRGDEVTSTKNWTVQTVPMIPEMLQLLERLKAERSNEPASASVISVYTCNGPLKASTVEFRTLWCLGGVLMTWTTFNGYWLRVKTPQKGELMSKRQNFKLDPGTGFEAGKQGAGERQNDVGHDEAKFGRRGRKINAFKRLRGVRHAQRTALGNTDDSI